jgi:hypothetical protein
MHEHPEVAQAEVHHWFSTVYHNPGLTTEGEVSSTPEQVRERLEELVTMDATHLLLNTVTRLCRAGRGAGRSGRAVVGRCQSLA